MTITKRTAIALIIILALLLSAIPGLQIVETVQAKTLVAPDNYSTIQSAINAATSGDTIFVRNGIYHETLIVDKPVSLVGENKEATIIDGLRLDTVVQVIADCVNITGFKIINAANNGVYLKHSTGTTIKENIIDNGHYGICTGINLEYSHQNTVSNNLIIENFEGSMLNSSSSNIFLNNIFGDNVGSLWMTFSNNNYFDNNKFLESSGFSSLYITNCTNTLFRRNEISFSQNWGMYLAFYSTGNIFSENTFSQNRGDFLIHYCAYNTFIHNNIFVSGIDNQDCLNTWDDGEQGNYWSDCRGIGDTPYEINSSYPVGSLMRHNYGRDHDFHPLLTPFNLIFPSDPQTSIVSPENTTYNADSVALTLATKESTSGITYRLDGQIGIFARNTTLQWLSNGTHVLTTYATELDGNLVPLNRVVFYVNAIVNETRPPNERVYNYNWSPPSPTPPIVTILSPSQDKTYNTRDIALNFSVTEDEKYAVLDTTITKVEYVLDLVYFEPLMVYVGWITVPIIAGPELTKSYSITLSNVADGNHSLSVRATATSTKSPSVNVIVYNAASVKFAISTGSTASSSNSPQSTPTSSPSIHATPTTTSSSNESSVDFTLSGNVTSSQISKITIATNQSTRTTIVSFAVAGQSGTTGFSNITFSKRNLPYGATPTVYIDKEQCQDQGYTQDADNYYVWYTIHFSTHQVSINFISIAAIPTPTASPNQTFQQLNWLQIIIGAAAALVFIMIVIVVLKLVVSKKDNARYVQETSQI